MRWLVSPQQACHLPEMQKWLQIGLEHWSLHRVMERAGGYQYGGHHATFDPPLQHSITSSVTISEPMLWFGQAFPGAAVSTID